MGPHDGLIVANVRMAEVGSGHTPGGVIEKPEETHPIMAAVAGSPKDGNNAAESYGGNQYRESLHGLLLENLSNIVKLLP